MLGSLAGILTVIWVFSSPLQAESAEDAKIIFLHHSTGGNIWQGGVSAWFQQYNTDNGTNHQITEQSFPKSSPYGWNNYPYDYWNIWVNHAGNNPYMEEPTLEILTQQYDVIIWKHCFPVSNILEDTGSPDINSQSKRIENYKLQYAALKTKMRQFSNTKFIVWTGAALVRNATSEAKATRARSFFNWVRNEWDEAGDNIYLWDFYALETEGGLYFKDGYAASPNDSHPNSSFSQTVAPLFCQRIVNVIENDGNDPVGIGLYLSVRGRGNRISYRSMDESGNWTYWREFPGVKANASPAICKFNNRLYMFRKRGKYVYYKSMDENGNWSGWRTIRYRIKGAPAVCEYNGRLYLFAKGRRKSI